MIDQHRNDESNVAAPTIYMVDLLCDEDVAPFYLSIGGMHRAGGFITRNYEAQSGTGSGHAGD